MLIICVSVKCEISSIACYFFEGYSDDRYTCEMFLTNPRGIVDFTKIDGDHNVEKTDDDVTSIIFIVWL